MPFVSGFLRVRKHRHRPDQGLPPGEEPTDPDYGVEEGEVGGGDIDNELPEPPPGIWPPLTPEHPWRPVPGGGRPERPSQGLPPSPGRPPTVGGGLPPTPGHPMEPVEPGDEGSPEHLPSLPPGMIWPPLPPGVHGKYLVLIYVSGIGYRYTVIDASQRPERPGARPPERPHPEPPEAQPKR